MKKLNILFVISLLILSMDQLSASWRKPAAGAAGLAGSAVMAGSYGNNGQEKEDSQVKVPESQNADQIQTAPLLKFPVDQNYYSKFTQDTSKFGANGLREATAKLNKILLDRIEEEPIEGLAFSQLTSDRQRIKFLQNEFKGSQLSADFNIPLISHFTVNLPSNQQIQFIEQIHKFARNDTSKNDTSKIISMDVVDRALAHTILDGLSRQILQSAFGVSDKKSLDDLTVVSQIQVEERLLRNPQDKISFAYHESAHALMYILKGRYLIISQLSLKPQGVLGGAFIGMPQKAIGVNSSIQAKSYAIDEKLVDAKNKIMAFLAGGIGQELFNGEKLSFREFITSPKYREIGTPQLAGSDMNIVIQEAFYYCQFKNFSFVSMHQEDLEPHVLLSQEELQKQSFDFAEECYEEAYAILKANKDILDKIVTKTLKEGVTGGDKLYKIAGITRPKYEHELTLSEKVIQNIVNWLSWTHKRMAFYDRNHPQV